MTTVISAFPALMAAPAAEGGSQTGSMMTTFITFGLIILVFYFLIIRPQKKKEKEAKAMISAIKKGDKVITIGGIRGTVVAVKEDVVTLKVDDNSKIEFSKGAISTVVNKKESKPAAENKTETKSQPAPAKKQAATKAAIKKPEAEKKNAEKADQNEIKNKKEEKSNADSEKPE